MFSTLVTIHAGVCPWNDLSAWRLHRSKSLAFPTCETSYSTSNTSKVLSRTAQLQFLPDNLRSYLPLCGVRDENYDKQ